MAMFLFVGRGLLTQLQMHRHGSRGTASDDEQHAIQSLVNTLEEGRDAIQHAHLPKNLRFLKKGYHFDLKPRDLTVIGRQQLFNHGVEYALTRL